MVSRLPSCWPVRARPASRIGLLLLLDDEGNTDEDGEADINNLQIVATDGQDALLSADASSEHKEEKGFDPYDADNDLQKPQTEGHNSDEGLLPPFRGENAENNLQTPKIEGRIETKGSDPFQQTDTAPDKKSEGWDPPDEKSGFAPAPADEEHAVDSGAEFAAEAESDYDGVAADEAVFADPTDSDDDFYDKEAHADDFDADVFAGRVDEGASDYVAVSANLAEAVESGAEIVVPDPAIGMGSVVDKCVECLDPATDQRGLTPVAAYGEAGPAPYGGDLPLLSAIGTLFDPADAADEEIAEGLVPDSHDLFFDLVEDEYADFDDSNDCESGDAEHADAVVVAAYFTEPVDDDCASAATPDEFDAEFDEDAAPEYDAQSANNDEDGVADAYASHADAEAHAADADGSDASNSYDEAEDASANYISDEGTTAGSDSTALQSFYHEIAADAEAPEKGSVPVQTMASDSEDAAGAALPKLAYDTLAYADVIITHAMPRADPKVKKKTSLVLCLTIKTVFHPDYLFTLLRGSNCGQDCEEQNVGVQVRLQIVLPAGSCMKTKIFMMLIIHAELDPG